MGCGELAATIQTMLTTSSRGSTTASADLLFIFATALLVISMVAVQKLMRFLVTQL
jgi:hypothetical protein